MIAAIIVGGQLAVAVADRPPVVNFEQTCRDETTRDARTGDKFEHCVADEKRARDQITAQWSAFDPGARTRCARAATSGQTASYLELLVCLELEQADKEVRGEGSTTGTTIAEPGRPADERDQATDPSRSRPAPSQAAPVAAPSRPAVPSSAQQSSARAAVAQPASPPPAVSVPAAPEPVAPVPTSPAPAAESPPSSQGEYLRQSFCRSPLGLVLSGC